MNLCENCDSDIVNVYGSGRFCSQGCSRSFSTKNKRSEINEKVSNKLKGTGNGDVIKNCKECNNQFSVDWRRRNQECCSTSCSSKLKWKDTKYREDAVTASRNSALIKHKLGIGFGWRTRKKLEPSYPETIAIRFLDSLGIQYEREYKIGKYFVDFVIHETMTAIEIDGQQHLKEERKMVDDEKDKMLIKNGWKVHRIAYPKENVIERIKMILDDIPFA